AEGDARLWIEVFAESAAHRSATRIFREQRLEAKLGFAQPAADIDDVAGPSAGAPDSSPICYFADDRERDENFLRAGRVASCKGAMKAPSPANKPREEIVEPAPSKLLGKGQIQEEIA